MKPIAYINVEKRTLEFAEPIKWHTPTVANLDRIPLFTKEALAQRTEPVAWQFMNGSNFRKRRPDDFADLDSDGLPYWKPLYTTPPQRTEQDGQCKRCTDGCPACDATKLQKESHDLL